MRPGAIGQVGGGAVSHSTMTLPVVVLQVTPCHEQQSPLIQFVCALHDAPLVALYSARSAAASVSAQGSIAFLPRVLQSGVVNSGVRLPPNAHPPDCCFSSDAL